MTTKINKYYCPLCGEPADVVQSEDVQSEDDATMTWKRVHLECLGKCPVLEACVELPTECYEGE